MKTIYQYITRKTVVQTVFVSAFLFLFLSCEKEQKKYDGEPQLAFSQATYSVNVSSTSTEFTIPVQLIANANLQASGTISIDPASTCADDVTVTQQFTIAAGTFSYPVTVNVDYTALATGKNTLILQLNSPLKVAPYYKTATITINK